MIGLVVSESKDRLIARRNRERDRRGTKRPAPAPRAEFGWGHEKEYDQARRAAVIREVKRLATVYGRELARQCGLSFSELFADSLEGDLARRSVLRRLRREHPSVEFGTLDFIVTEMLAP